jgi:predicted metal-dependent hydrolase
LSGALQEEDLLQADPRLQQAIDLFNSGEWYACHDGLEELWHETQGPMRPVLQGLLQIAVAHLHLERGNRHGATVLMGEGLGRLAGSGEAALGVHLSPLRDRVSALLTALQSGGDPTQLPPPRLERAPSQRR